MEDYLAGRSMGLGQENGRALSPGRRVVVCGMRNGSRLKRGRAHEPHSAWGLRRFLASQTETRDRRRKTQNSNLQQDRLDGHGPNWRFFTLQSLRENKNEKLFLALFSAAIQSTAAAVSHSATKTRNKKLTHLLGASRPAVPGDGGDELRHGECAVHARAGLRGRGHLPPGVCPVALGPLQGLVLVSISIRFRFRLEGGRRKTRRGEGQKKRRREERKVQQLINATKRKGNQQSINGRIETVRLNTNRRDENARAISNQSMIVSRLSGSTRAGGTRWFAAAVLYFYARSAAAAFTSTSSCCCLHIKNHPGLVSIQYLLLSRHQSLYSSRHSTRSISVATS